MINIDYFTNTEKIIVSGFPIKILDVKDLQNKNKKGFSSYWSGHEICLRQKY